MKNKNSELKIYMVPRVRIELTTLASSGRRSTNELPRLVVRPRRTPFPQKNL